MAFTRANRVARLLVSVLDIEFVPDVVKWTYRGQIYNLEIEFEDTDLFAEALAGTDADMHDKDDGSGNKEARGEDVGRELSNGLGSASQTPGNGAAPSATVPTNTLRFGSFEPASAPPRLWSDRMECDDVLEHTIPHLDFADADGSLDG